MSKKRNHVSGWCCRPGAQLEHETVRWSWRLFRFVATAPIHSVFGAEVQGQIMGCGITRSRALRDLSKQEEEFFESLWL